MPLKLVDSLLLRLFVRAQGGCAFTAHIFNLCAFRSGTISLKCLFTYSVTLIVIRNSDTTTVQRATLEQRDAAAAEFAKKSKEETER